MKEYVLPLLIGIIFGAIDVLPMMKNKLDRYSIGSAFAYHVIMPLIVYHLAINIPWWIKGSIIYLVCASPVMILISKEDKKSVPIVAVTSVIIGFFVSGLAYVFS